jgi:trypsin-like peptidase
VRFHAHLEELDALRPMKALTIVLLVLALDAHAVVIGNDDRYTPAAKQTPELYRGVGFLDCISRTDKEDATGSLIFNDRMIVTVAHLFFNNDGSKKFGPSDCTFNVSSNQGEILATVRVEAVWPYSKHVGSSSTQHKDALIARLVAPVRGVHLLTLRSIMPRVGQKMRLCSYSDDLVDNKRIKRCLEGVIRDSGADSKIAANARLVLHDIDSYHGSSGGPLIRLTDEEDEIFGMQVSMFPGTKYDRPIRERVYEEYDVNKRFNAAMYFTDDFINFAANIYHREILTAEQR